MIIVIHCQCNGPGEMIKEPHPAGSKGGKMKRALAIGIILLFIASSISISNEAGQEKIKNGDRRKIYQWMEAGIKADYATDMSNVSIDSTAFATIVDGQVFHIYEGLPWCLYVTAYWDPPQGQPICIWVDLNTLPEGARIIPEGCSCGIDSVTITLEWTPAISQAGTYVIRFYVGYECYQAYSYFDITVIVEPYVPTPTETFRICAEEEFVLNVTAYWEPPQPEKLICLWIYEPSLPEGATFDECHCDYGSVTSTLRWTPSSEQVGEYIVTFLAGEDCGYYTFPFSIEIIVEICDTEPPVVVIEYPEDGATFTEPNITAWGYVTDNVGVVSFGYTHEWEGGRRGSSWPLDEPTTNYPFEIQLTLHEGWNRIKVYATDATGNNGSDEETIYYVVDTTPPVIEKIKPINGIYVNDRQIMPFIFPVVIGGITVEVNVIDNESGVKKVDFYIDDNIKAGDTVEPYAWKWGGTYFGLHTIKIVAYDNAGNYGEHEEKVFIINWKGETTKIPRPVITSPIDKQAVGGMVRINVTEEENATDISYCRFSYFDGEKWIEIDTDYGYVVDAAIYRGGWFVWWDTSDLSTGYYKIRAEMENSEGYIGYDEIELYVERSPVIVVDIVEYDPETGRTVFDASGSYDPDGEITNVYWTFWTYPNVTNISGFRVEYVYPGNYTFSVKLVDNLGVISTGLFFDMKGTAEKNFAVEFQEIHKKISVLDKIVKEKENILKKIKEQPGAWELNFSIGSIKNAIECLQWSRGWLKDAIWWQKYGNEKEEKKCVGQAKEKTDLAAEWLKKSIKDLKNATGKIKDATIKKQLENNIEKLKKIYIQIVCLSAKIWIIEEIGATTHGAEIPMPKDIWIGKGGSYYRMSNQSIHIDKDHVYCHDVILHEFDHHFMYKKNYKKSLPGGSHDFCKKSSKKMAWSEGWAHFSSCAKRNSPIFSDPKWRGDDSDIENMKSAGPDGKWGTADDYDCPSAANKGDEAEASIAGILWDLYDDTPNEKDAAGKKFDQVSLPFKTIVEAMNIKKTATNQGDIHDFYNRLKNVLIKEGKWNADLEKKIRDIFLNHGVTP
ncbi:MAG: hypothetical protein J7K47_02555 [Thermoplasmata archaeon]|nr:hypothetical protein [Thermoplasmata archaeon]